MPTCRSYFSLQDISFKLRHQTIFREDVIISSRDQSEDFGQEKKKRYDSFCYYRLITTFPPYPFLLSFPQSSQTSTTVIHFLYFPPITNKTWVISYNPIKFLQMAEEIS